jgi:hypothetical protein
VHASAASFWLGTSTTDTSTIDQTGVDLDPSNDTGYQYWDELFPLDSFYSNNGNDMPWKAGQSIQLTDSYATDSGGHFTFQAYNITTGIIYYLSYTNAASYFHTAAANFVTEKLGSYERDFGTVNWSNARVIYADGTAHYPGTLSYETYTSAFATESAPSGGSMTMKWTAC